MVPLSRPPAEGTTGLLLFPFEQLRLRLAGVSLELLPTSVGYEEDKSASQGQKHRDAGAAVCKAVLRVMNQEKKGNNEYNSDNHPSCEDRPCKSHVGVDQKV